MSNVIQSLSLLVLNDKSFLHLAMSDSHITRVQHQQKDPFGDELIMED